MIKQLDPEYLIAKPQRKREVLLWMYEHGIHPNSVPMDATIEFLDNHQVEVETWDSIKGKKFVVVDGKYPFPMDVLM